MTVDNDNMLFKWLATSGDAVECTGNYSITPAEFFIQPPAGSTYELTRMLVSAQDTGAFDAEEYGNGITLTNGLSVLVTDSSDVTIIDLLDGQPIKTNAHWGRQCYDVDVKTWGTGDEVMLVRWTFERAGSKLLLEDQQKLKVIASDNFTGLVSHMFQVQGISYEDVATG